MSAEVAGCWEAEAGLRVKIVGGNQHSVWGQPRFQCTVTQNFGGAVTSLPCIAPWARGESEGWSWKLKCQRIILDVRDEKTHAVRWFSTAWSMQDAAYFYLFNVRLKACTESRLNCTPEAFSSLYAPNRFWPTTLLLNSLKRLHVLQLRFDFDSTRQSGTHDSMLMKAWIHTRRHFTSEVCERAIPTSTIERCYPMSIRQRECHSYYRDVYTITSI